MESASWTRLLASRSRSERPSTRLAPDRWIRARRPWPRPSARDRPSASALAIRRWYSAQRVPLASRHLVARIARLRHSPLRSRRSRVPAPLVPRPGELFDVGRIPQSSQLGLCNRLETAFTCKLSHPLGRHVQTACDLACGYQGGCLFHHFLIVATASGMFQCQNRCNLTACRSPELRWSKRPERPATRSRSA